MKVFICGIEGYLGWSLACHLTQLGHTVAGLDNGSRDQRVMDVGSDTAIPISSRMERICALEDAHRQTVDILRADMGLEVLIARLEGFQPDAVVHLAQMPSAPWSMKYPALTMQENVLSTCALLMAVKEVDPSVHILKLGTMGEYGTPKGKIIPEAPVSEFPRKPGSFYHASKVCDSVNTELACRMWGLRATDVMQGVVYGTYIPAFHEDPRLRTRFDYDECFGTVINRFCAQAVAGLTITPYGAGKQKRGFLPLEDSMQCLTLLLQKPAAEGEYRVVNQFDGVYQIDRLAATVSEEAEKLNLKPTVSCIANPRIEEEDHQYHVAVEKLPRMGYDPISDMRGTIARMLKDLLPHKYRILKHTASIYPKIGWRGV